MYGPVVGSGFVPASFGGDPFGQDRGVRHRELVRELGVGLRSGGSSPCSLASSPMTPLDRSQVAGVFRHAAAPTMPL